MFNVKQNTYIATLKVSVVIFYKENLNNIKAHLNEMFLEVFNPYNNFIHG